METIKIICVVGPTASGKTALAVELAKHLNGEIISADSMQVYRGMPIATAAATTEEQAGIPHHFVEFLEPESTFSVADFVTLAKEKAFEIAARGRVPIVAGGTGLFIDSLVKNITFSDVGADTELRQALDEKDNDTLYAQLCRVDAAAAKEIHKNNRKRVMRALELYYGGVSKTQQNADSLLEESPFEALYIGINYRDRALLYERIDRRVDGMVAAGLEQEAKTALATSGTTARQAIGHKELQPYFEGAIDFNTAIDNLKKETRHYAKRQLTWFKRNPQTLWLYADEMTREDLYNAATDAAKEFLNR